MSGTAAEFDMTTIRESWNSARAEIQWRVSMRVSRIPQGKLMESETQTQMLFDILNDTFNFFGDVDIFGDTLSQINDFWANYFKDIEDSQITEFNLDIVKKSIFDSLAN